MKNLVEILSGEHGNVKLLLNEPERKKLAQMRSFLSAEDEIYAQIGHYDLAEVSEDKIEGLLDLTFDKDQIALPDDVEDLLEDLRRDVGTDKEVASEKGGVFTCCKSSQFYPAAMAATLFFTLFSSTYFMANTGHGTSDEQVAIALLDTSKIDIDVPELPMITSASVPPASSATNPDQTLSSEDAQTTALAPPSSSTWPYMLAYDHVPASDGSKFVDATSINQLPTTLTAILLEGSWQSEFSTDMDPEDLSQKLIDTLQMSIGGQVVSHVTQGENLNIIARTGDIEIHVFRFVLTERGDSVYKLAMQTDIDPKIQNLITKILEGNNKIDTTSMNLNDTLLGVATKSGDIYSISELIYDRPKYEMIRYSN